MDRHTLEQIGSKVGELLRYGSSSCIRQANNIMVENFETVLYFALELTEPKPKPKHTIADNYPAGGLTATEPCMYCKDYSKLQERNEKLETENKHFRKLLEEIKENPLVAMKIAQVLGGQNERET